MYNFGEQCRQSMSVVCLICCYYIHLDIKCIIKQLLDLVFGAPYFIRGLTGLEMCIIILLRYTLT